jgi:16S rRNA (uracil1498-N3)-methyltransferase
LPQFFLNDINSDGTFIIIGSDFYHLSRVRRIKINDVIKVRYKGTLYEASVISILSDSIEAKLGCVVSGAVDRTDVTLLCAMLKSGNFDFVIQKAVETGASRIIPVYTERTITDISNKKKSKIDRWKKISQEASKQSLRESPPEICEPLEFIEALKIGSCGLKIIAHPGAELNIKDVLAHIEKNIPVTVFIGPEGGFTDRELSDAYGNGFTGVNFGFSHLRAETAVIVFLSIIIYEMSGK